MAPSHHGGCLPTLWAGGHRCINGLLPLLRRFVKMSPHTSLRLLHFKITMSMDVLRCMTVGGVLKELMVFAIVYNLVRGVMVDAARRQKVHVDRLSLIDAMRWLVVARPRGVLIKLMDNILLMQDRTPRADGQRETGVAGPGEWQWSRLPGAIRRGAVRSRGSARGGCNLRTADDRSRSRASA
jgi:hypothetical protein